MEKGKPEGKSNKKVWGIEHVKSEHGWYHGKRSSSNTNDWGGRNEGTAIIWGGTYTNNNWQGRTEQDNSWGNSWFNPPPPPATPQGMNTKAVAANLTHQAPKGPNNIKRH